MITYAIDAVALDDPAKRWRLIKGTVFSPPVNIRGVDTVIPGVDGILPSTYEAQDAPILTLKIEVKAATDLLLTNYVAELLSAFDPPAGVMVTRTVDGAVHTAAAKLVSVAEPAYFAAAKRVTITAVFKIPGVWWRSVGADYASGVIAASPTTHVLGGLAGSTAPIDDALVLITGPISNPRITGADGGWIQLTTTVAAGEKALIDTAAATVRRGTGVTFTGGGTDATATLSWGGASFLRPLRLRPSAGTVSVQLTGVGYSSATRLGVRAQKAHRI